MDAHHVRIHLPCLRSTGPNMCVYTAEDFTERMDLAFLSNLPTRANTTLMLSPLLHNPPQKPCLLPHSVMQAESCAPPPPPETQLTGPTRSPTVSKPRGFLFS